MFIDYIDGGCMDNNFVTITYAKNLTKFNFTTTASIPIDNNANIKTILNVDSYSFDKRVECTSNKAILTGKIGVKVLYIDTDNMTNTLSDTLTFSETILDNSITSDCYLNVSNCNVLSQVLSRDGSLKISCEVSVTPVVYINIALANNVANTENMITRVSSVEATTMSDRVNSTTTNTVNLECRDTVSKILCYDSSITGVTITAYDEYAVVEGKIHSHLLYECMHEDESELKELFETNSLKAEVQIPGLTHDCQLDVNVCLDRSKEVLTSDLEDGVNIVNVQHTISVEGISTKNITVNVLDDAYSVENEIELSTTTREIDIMHQCDKVVDTISGEITLAPDETAIDMIIANLNTVAELTNSYIKDQTLYFEGVISSHLIYLDENKELKGRTVELPFVVKTKTELDHLDCVRTNVTITDSRVRAKRGTIIELEYTLDITMCMYIHNSRAMIDNVTVGKAIDNSMYDYQIFIAKPNESMWDLCKRIKIAPEDISKFNKDLPLVMTGGERVVIKR